jgi:hypothetical protein
LLQVWGVHLTVTAVAVTDPSEAVLPPTFTVLPGLREATDDGLLTVVELLV